MNNAFSRRRWQKPIACISHGSDPFMARIPFDYSAKLINANFYIVPAEIAV